MAANILVCWAFVTFGWSFWASTLKPAKRQSKREIVLYSAIALALIPFGVAIYLDSYNSENASTCVIIGVFGAQFIAMIAGLSMGSRRD